MKRIGILTGGGDCPGLNAVIASIVKAGIGHDFEFWGFRNGFEGLLGEGDYMLLDTDAVRGISHLGGTILGTTNKGHFSSKVGSGTEQLVDMSIIQEVKDNLAKWSVDGLVVIGGDGSLGTALQMFESGINIVGVPKTIDNDLEVTERTFGFSTGVEIISECLGRIHTTAVSHGRVFLVETMGRNCGWLSLYGGISGGADVILVPEIQFDYQKIVDFLRAREHNGRGYAVVAVAEGVKLDGGQQVVATEATEGENTLGGAVEVISRRLNQLAPNEFEIKTQVLGHLQRGGAPNAEDRILAARFGFGAFECIERGHWGNMVALSGDKIIKVELATAVSKLKFVDINSDVVRMAKAEGISFGD